jgi:hypothetical protein
VVQLHYVISLAELATGYIIADDLDDDGAQGAHTAADLFPNAAPAGPLEP